ncbi:MAG: glycosyltransferase family 4 protein [Candidatus Moranbacteria bacterium]|jgi:glycosyltransferase involved in cell wall biosynthesis|nr:glycosyltransferase family 4 protein [Candidatus Moranbacteria bacterium]
MRIGIDARCLQGKVRSGVEEYARTLLEELFRQDAENSYLLFVNAWDSSELDFSWVKKYPRVSIRVFHWPNKLLNFCFWYLGWPKMDRMLGGVDVFFLPNLNFVALSKKTRLIVTTHDLSFELFPETFSWKRRIWHFFVHFRSIVKRADRVIAISQSTADDLRAVYKTSEQKITVILSGVRDIFRPVSHNDPSLLGIQEKYHLPYKFILSLGTIEPRKNLIALLRAFEVMHASGHPELMKYSLVIAGEEGWNSGKFFEYVKKSPVKEKIILTGFVADEDKPGLYSLASAFVYPSLYEGFGFPPLEAIACGVPVIVSHTSALPEVVGTSALLIDPYRPEEILQSLRQLLLSKELRLAFRNTGPVQASRFSWVRTAEKVRACFEGRV